MLSKRIRWILDNCGLTQAELARQLGITRAAVNGWVNDRSSSINADSLIKLAKIAHVNSNWLLSGQGSPKIKPVEAQEHKDRDILQVSQQMTDNEYDLFLILGQQIVSMRAKGKPVTNIRQD